MREIGLNPNRAIPLQMKCQIVPNDWLSGAQERWAVDLWLQLFLVAQAL